MAISAICSDDQLSAFRAEKKSFPRIRPRRRSWAKYANTASTLL